MNFKVVWLLYVQQQFSNFTMNVPYFSLLRGVTLVTLLRGGTVG